MKVALRAALNMQRKSRPLPHPPAKLREPGRCAYEDHKWKQGRCKRCLLRQSEAEDILSGGFYCDVADCGCRAQNEDDGPMDEDAPQIGPITLTPSLGSQLALDPSFFPDPPLATDRNIPEGILWTIRRVGSSIANVSDTSSVSSLHVPETRLPRSPGYMDLRSALDHPDHPDQPLPGSQAVSDEVDYDSFLAQLPITATLLSAQADAALSRRRSDRSAGPEPSTRPTTGQQQERLYHWTILNLRHRESRSVAPEPSTRTGSVEQPSAGPSRNASQKQGRQEGQQEESEGGSWRTISEEVGLEEEDGEGDEGMDEGMDEGTEDWRLWCE